MLSDDILDEAVRRGTINAAQAGELRRMAAAQVGQGQAEPVEGQLAQEERFRLLGGLNDIFIAAGVVLLVSGIGYALGMKSFAQVFYGPLGAPSFMWWGGATLLLWAMAELLTARLRLTAPSIVLAVCVPVFATFSAAALLIRPDLKSEAGTWITIGLVCVAVAAAVLHYARFRLPFSLLVIAATGLALVLALVILPFHELRDFSRVQSAVRTANLVTLGYGLAVFAAAMRFDLSDPARTTRRADCGFWLHVAAAPMLVHPLTTVILGGGYRAAWPTVALIVSLALVALVIDRRALLVAGLGYLGGAITYMMSGLTSPGSAPIATLMFIGALMIGLGVGWRHLRAGLMRLVPNNPLKTRLPPYGPRP